MNGSSHERKNGTSEEWEPQGSFSVWRARLETFSGLKPREIDCCRGAGGPVKCVDRNPGIYLVFRRQYLAALLMLVLRTPLTLL